MKMDEPTLMSSARVPENPFSPSRAKNILLGFVVGFVLACGVVVLLEFVLNITAKELETALQEITGAGYRILVAHIERYPCLAPLSVGCFMKKLMGKERSFVKKCGVSVFLCKKTCESKDKVLN